MAHYAPRSAPGRRRASNRPAVPFTYKLVLDQWLLGLFNIKRFEDLAEHLRNEALGGLDENNVHHFHHALVAQLFNLTQLPTELLLEYDQNIVKHTQRLNERRITRGEEPIVWKYFQYLTLLFTEIYLDRYFRDAEDLLQALNAQISAYNMDKSVADQIAPWDEQAEAWPQLNKLAYWSATGSGKTALPEDVTRPKHIGVLETLTIFGIRADYMAQFRDFLEEEGLPTNEEPIEILLPVIKNLGTQKLKTIRLKKMINGVSTEFGDAFRKLGPIPTLAKPDPSQDPATYYLQQNQVILNWYPKIQALKSGGVVGGDTEAAPNQTHLTARHVAFLDLDRLYFELERFKAERGWHNLNLTREGLHPLLVDQSWYRLLIPAEEMAFDSFEKIRLWEEIALLLLKKYTERYYTFRKREWELPHLEYRDLEADDPNFLGVKEAPEDGYYRIQIEKSQEEIIEKLKELKALIEKGDLKPWEFRGMKAIWFGRHLYQPLLYLDQSIVEISPAPLNKGERQFVEDLKAFHDSANVFFADKELYLLRNLSKGRGVGFFEAGNFHPDFILWLLMGGRQHVIFVDPKGIRNLGATDPKIQFHRTIKEIEQRLGDASVRLQSFIVSNTPSHTMKKLWNMDKPAMAAQHILFQEEDKDTYVRSMLEVVNPTGTSTTSDAVPS